MGQMFDEKLDEYRRKGDQAKVKWMQNLNRIILPSQAQRIVQGDKTVLREIFLPSWASWELIQDWALGRPQAKTNMCVLCNNNNDLGMAFNGKFLCHDCFLKIKNMQ